MKPVIILDNILDEENNTISYDMLLHGGLFLNILEHESVHKKQLNNSNLDSFIVPSPMDMVKYLSNKKKCWTLVSRLTHTVGLALEP